MLDVERPVVVLDVVAPLLEPLRLQLLAERLLHQSRRGVTAPIVTQLLEKLRKIIYSPLDSNSTRFLFCSINIEVRI